MKRDLVAAQLLLTAIDVTAGLCRPADQEETKRAQFIDWADKYLTLEGRYYRLTGMDLYGARCGLLHGYTPEARVVRTGEAKVLACLDDAGEPLFTDLTPKLVIVSLRLLFQAYMTGLVETMKSINQLEDLSAVVNPRLETIFHATTLPEKFRAL